MANKFVHTTNFLIMTFIWGIGKGEWCDREGYNWSISLQIAVFIRHQFSTWIYKTLHCMIWIERYVVSSPSCVWIWSLDLTFEYCICPIKAGRYLKRCHMLILELFNNLELSWSQNTWIRNYFSKTREEFKTTWLVKEPVKWRLELALRQVNLMKRK